MKVLKDLKDLNGAVKLIPRDEVEKAEAGGLNLITGKPERKALFFESMTEVNCKETGSRCRVWRAVDEMPEYVDVDVMAAFAVIPGGVSMPDMVRILGSIPGVTAVELVDKNGCGGIAYFEW